MSNPLLKPNDPRFQKPDVRDAGGQNRFGDEQHAAKSSATDSPAAASDLFATAAAGEARPYEPKYEVQQKARVGTLTLLYLVGWACGLTGVVSLTGLMFSLGWLLPVLGIVPTATAWLLAHEDLKAVRAGAIDPSAGPRTRQIFWLGLFGFLFCIAVVAAMAWRGMSMLPDLF